MTCLVPGGSRTPAAIKWNVIQFRWLFQMILLWWRMGLTFELVITGSTLDRWQAINLTNAGYHVVIGHCLQTHEILAQIGICHKKIKIDFECFTESCRGEWVKILRPGDTYMCQWTSSPLVELLVCYLRIWWQAITWTNADLLSFGPLGAKLSEILTNYKTFHSRNVFENVVCERTFSHLVSVSIS